MGADGTFVGRNGIHKVVQIIFSNTQRVHPRLFKRFTEFESGVQVAVDLVSA